MPDFELDPLGYWHSPGFRAITCKPEWLNDPSRWQRGWDVYALQTGLNVWADPDIDADGICGPRTREAILRFQRNRGLTADGIAGGATQTLVARKIAPKATDLYNIVPNLLKGHLEKESGNWLGNHTARYETTDSYDLGVAQINDKSKQLAWDQCFDTPFAIDFLGQTVRKAYDTYKKPSQAKTDRLKARGLPTPDNRRLWELAGGSWNRPAHTAWLAGETDANSDKPSATELTWIEGYIDRVTVYVTNWSQT